MSDFRDLVAEHGGEDYTVTAQAILAALKIRGHAADVLLGVVANSVRIVMRGSALQVEIEAFDPSGVAAISRGQFLHTHFALGDGRWVKWGEATIEDHSTRIALLVGLRTGIDATIRRHADVNEESVS